ncbi:MAG TPA: hypothetical protein VGN83_19065 [Falsiroseomonas sp.]|nr:hypothetical protein [Falsiroseomonas sp.]
MAEARERQGIVPLESNALALRLSTLRPGPDLAAGLDAARTPDPQGDLLEAPSAAERRLRGRLGELVASQAIEDMAEGVAHTLVPAGRGDGLYHAYNAALKRVTGGKSRAEMTLAELEAAVEWLGRNRLRDHLHLLDGDHRFGWRARPRGEWRPPVGRPAGSLDGGSPSQHARPLVAPWRAARDRSVRRARTAGPPLPVLPWRPPCRVGSVG